MNENKQKKNIKILIGKKYYIYYDENSPFNNGGNGEVFCVERIIDKNTNNIVNTLGNYVLKKLYRDEEQRIKRFKNEILFVLENHEKLRNIVAVEDYDNKDYSWYLMKEYDVLYEKSNLPFSQKIKLLLDVAYALKSIHVLPGRHAHRDVKPSNILIDNKGKALLADFGCVFMGDDNRITKINEGIGPASIRPIELYSHNKNKNIDYRFSDVYLFAKTCWMFLLNNNEGFPGEYSLSFKNIYLRNVFGTQTIEPIQELLISATKTNWEERIDINKCIQHLQKQLDICNGTINMNELMVMINKENTNAALSNYRPVKNSFGNEITMCEAFLSKLAKGTLLKIFSTNDDCVALKYDGFANNGNGIYHIDGDSTSFYKQIAFSIKNIEYDTVNCKIIVKCSRLDDNDEIIEQSFIKQTLCLNEENRIEIDIC